MMANPPYGVTWKKDADFIRNEALNPFGRFTAGLLVHQTDSYFSYNI